MHKAYFTLPVMILALLLGACGDSESWHGRDISGLMPDLAFELTSEQGKPISEQAFRGKVTPMFFGYTHCPDYCPATLSRLAQAIQLLPEDLQEQVRVLFVAVDPKRDTPGHLREYTAFFDRNIAADITGVTGSKEDLLALARRYRTTFSYGKPDENGDYIVSHGQAIYLFDKQGRVRLMLLDEQTVEQIAEDLERLAEQD